MAKPDPFKALTRNAFDFLERAIKEFAAEPKYSVIHFCAAVEMLLKARLMKEHWALIVSKPELASLSKFEAGDFISVTLDECRVRLREVAGEDIGGDAYSTFKALANHRNKMVHFFHADIDGGKAAKERIVAEQCRAWLQLHRLLTAWPQFGDFHGDVARADRAMKKHRAFLKTKFESLKDVLTGEAASGGKHQRCSACNFKAALGKPIDEQIETVRCRVCDHEETQLEIECPHCSKPIVLTNEGFATCPHCDKQVEPDDVVDALLDPADQHRAFKDGDDSAAPANCDFCGGHRTVVGRGGFTFFCASCFEVADGISQCQWCHEFGTGDMDGSYSFGCGQCSGRAGYEGSD